VEKEGTESFSTKTQGLTVKSVDFRVVKEGLTGRKEKRIVHACCDYNARQTRDMKPRVSKCDN